MTRAIALAFSCVLAGLSLGTAAQTPAPPGTPQAQPPLATAVIVGQVVSGASTDGIAEAIVTLTRQGGAPAAGAGGGRAAGPAAPFAARRLMTGADGRFVFHGLPPGTYLVAVTRAGYSAQAGMNVAGVFGAQAIVSSAPAQQRVTLAEGEVASDVRIRLLQHAVVTGTVLDEAGEPAIGIVVQAARRVMTAGRPRYVPVMSQARADDRGEFRIPSLTPGDYIVLVPQTQITMPAGLMEGLIQAAATGDQVSAMGPLMDLMASGVNPGAVFGTGLRVGSLMVASATGTIPIPTEDGRLVAYQTMFYPGTSAPGQASVVRLAAGEQRGGINFRLQMIRTMRISGTALRPDGRPYASLGVRLAATGDPSAPNVELDVASAVTDAQGRFDFFALPPGQFVVRALIQPRQGIPGMAAAAAAAGADASPWVAVLGGSGDSPMLHAQEPVTLGSADVENLVLQLREGARVSGRVEFESTSGRQPPAQPALALMLTPADGWASPGPLLNTPEQPAVKDGQFTTRGYPPGRYQVGVQMGGWMLKSATLAGADVLDAPLEIRDTPVSGLVLTLTDRLPSVAGTVAADEVADRGDTTVVLFPADHRAWVARGMASRRLHVGSVDRTGAFTLPNVPAGDYLIVAIARSDEGDTQDPAFIERLAPLATRVTVDLAMAPQALSRVRVAR